MQLATIALAIFALCILFILIWQAKATDRLLARHGAKALISSARSKVTVPAGARVGMLVWNQKLTQPQLLLFSEDGNRVFAVIAEAAGRFFNIESTGWTAKLFLQKGITDAQWCLEYPNQDREPLSDLSPDVLSELNLEIFKKPYKLRREALAFTNGDVRDAEGALLLSWKLVKRQPTRVFLIVYDAGLDERVLQILSCIGPRY